MEENCVKLSEYSVEEIAKENIKFRVPSYQRGYRWEEDEVARLLDDIEKACKVDKDEKYCLQPIVVHKTEASGETIYELIDGQQRITTIFLIYKYMHSLMKNWVENLNNSTLDEKKYPNVQFTVSYENESRKQAETFLQSLDEKEKNTNIDFYHMYAAYKKIEEWFGASTSKVENFYKFFENNVRIIWYEIPNDNVKEITGKSLEKLFTDINTGKIRLTNSELIKALFLYEITNKNNEINKDITSLQQEIALQWIEIERELHNKSFWYFLTNEDIEDYPTKIDLLLNLKLDDNKKGEFDSFYAYWQELENGKTQKELWKEIYENYLLLRDWYDDIDYYNRIGYLISAESKTIKDIFKLYKSQYENGDKKIMISSREDFVKNLDEWIKESIAFTNDDKQKGKKYLDWSYEDDYKKLLKLLLLFNVLSIGKFDKSCLNKERFPFDKYNEKTIDINKKKNIAWSLEHIDPQHPENECPLHTVPEWKDWIKEQISLYEKLLKIKDKNDKKDNPENDEIYKIMKDVEAEKIPVTEQLFKKCRNKILYEYNGKKELDDKERDYLHRIDNMALLSTNINAALSNSLFYTKRAKIIEKDLEGEYIPFCTRMVFYKYYTEGASENIIWDEESRMYYLKQISEILKKYMEKEGKEEIDNLVAEYIKRQNK